MTTDRMSARTLRRAVSAVATGGTAVLVDELAKEHESYLVFAAQYAQPAVTAFVVRHTSGFVCAAIDCQHADTLGLPAQPQDLPHHTDMFAVTVDARQGVTTGISASDRAVTLRLLGSAQTKSDHLRRPGHIVPVRAHHRGVLGHPGVAEAAVELVRLVGAHPAAGFAALVSPVDPRRMATDTEAHDFAQLHGLPVITVGSILVHRHRAERLKMGGRQTQVTLADPESGVCEYPIADVGGDLDRTERPSKADQSGGYTNHPHTIMLTWLPQQRCRNAVRHLLGDGQPALSCSPHANQGHFTVDPGTAPSSHGH